MCRRRVWTVICVVSCGVLLVAAPACVWSQEVPAPNQRTLEPVRRELAKLLTQLAASAEHSTMGGRMGYAGHSPPDIMRLCRVVRFLALLPPSERYAKLKQWMFPGTPGAQPRTAMCLAPPESPPEFFFSDLKVPAWGINEPYAAGTVSGQDGVICFSELLVAAAAKCGKLEELAAAVRASGENPQMADTLSLLTSFALERDDHLARRADTIIAAWRRDDRSRDRLPPWPAYMVARTWMRSDQYRDRGVQLALLLAEHAAHTGKRTMVSYIHRDLAACRVQQAGGALGVGDDPQLARWHPSGYWSSSATRAGSWPGWWCQYDGTIVHVSGPEVSPLYFDYPLRGDFELSVDAYCEPAAAAAVQYGRFVFEPRGDGGKIRLLTIGERDILNAPGLAVPPTQFHRLMIRVSADDVRYFCNEVLVYEDRRPSPTTPWLALLGRCDRTTAWRNLQLAGHPEIPREVHLVEGNRMEGWMSPLYRERLPRQLRRGLTDDSAPTASPTVQPGWNWYAAEGVLHGPCLTVGNQDFIIQSWLAYCRPLRPGDTLSYEFFYQPREQCVHPSLGRTALLLEPDGVRLHWITDVPHISVGELSVDNAVMIAQAQRGPRPFSLKPDQWNMVTIRMADDAATVLLNGNVVYVHKLTATGNRLFGFFRYRNRAAANIRHIVLRASWPRDLPVPQLAQFAPGPDAAESAEHRQCRAAVIHEFRHQRQGHRQ